MTDPTLGARQVEHFKLNGVDVGFGPATEVRVTRGKVRMHVSTPPLRLTRDLHGGLQDQPFLPIKDPYLENGLRLITELALPNGRYGYRRTWPFRDESGYLHQIRVQGASFFGSLTIEAGWLELDGIASFEIHDRDKLPVPDGNGAMPISVHKRFEPGRLIPPRKRLMKWRDAISLPPEEVFELWIDRGEGEWDAFPEEIASFINLEFLVFRARASRRGQALETLPPVLFDLTNLHTLRFLAHGASLGTIHPDIARLTSLVELQLSSQDITGVPDAITTLEGLEELDLSYNQLKQLPQDIGAMPALRRLRVEGNRFVSLPSSLKQVPRLEIDYPDRALFDDISYRFGDPSLVDDKVFALPGDLRSSLARLFQAKSADRELNALAVDAARFTIYATPVPSEGLLPLGASKTGGAPHLPVGMEHPADVNGFLHPFLAQINLSEVAGLQSWLPRHGMLYFFAGDEDTPPQVVHVADTSVALRRWSYADAPLGWIDPDQRLSDVANEFAMRFSAGVSLPDFAYSRDWLTMAPALQDRFREISARKDARKRIEAFHGVCIHAIQAGLVEAGLSQSGHDFNGYPYCDAESPQEQAATIHGGWPHEWINLLTLVSVGGLKIWKSDGIAVTYSIHKADLAIRDFSRVVES